MYLLLQSFFYNACLNSGMNVLHSHVTCVLEDEDRICSPVNVELKLVMSCMLKLFSGSVSSVYRNRSSSQLEYLFGQSVLNRMCVSLSEYSFLKIFKSSLLYSFAHIYIFLLHYCQLHL